MPSNANYNFVEERNSNVNIPNKRHHVLHHETPRTLVHMYIN